MSVDYYIRLEQGRGPHPSRQMPSALARALMLTADERDYLFRMAGESPPPVAGPSREITPGIRHLLDSMPETAAYAVDAVYDALAWNRPATRFIGDLFGIEKAAGQIWHRPGVNKSAVPRGAWHHRGMSTRQMSEDNEHGL